MVQLLMALAALAECPGLIHSSHTGGSQLPSLQFQKIQWPFPASVGTCTHMGRMDTCRHTYIHIKQKVNLFLKA